jgi:hypothetical protein
MSKSSASAAVAAVLVALTSAAYAAQEARTLSVTATIPGTCVLSTSGPMAFGTLNMASTTAETKDVVATYKCATGLTVSSFSVCGVTTGSFSGAMTGLSPTNTDTIPYSISWTPPAAYQGEGFAVTGRQVTLSGTIQNAAYISKTPDSYAHSVVLAINY